MQESVIKGLITKLNNELDGLGLGEVLIKSNLHADVYHGANGVSTSKLKLFIECPAKYYARYVTGETAQAPTGFFDVGRAAHGLMLEPKKFSAEFVKQPADIKVRRGKVWDAFKELHKDKTVITSADWQACHDMRNAVERHAFGGRLLNGGKAEVSFFRRDPETGLVVKCRTDYLIGDLVVDLKTAASSDPRFFRKKAVDLGYHIQDAVYRDVTGCPEFAFVVVETAAPHIVTAPILFDEQARRLGFLKYRKALRDLAACTESGFWPTYSDTPVTLSLNGFEKAQLEELETMEAA